jgi:poly(3-hydroxyalkanoate) synthetase
MDNLIFTYIPLVICVIAAFYAHVRVRRLSKLTANVGFEQISDLEGDVAALKNQIRKLNGRLSGLETPRQDSMLEAKKLVEQMAFQNVQNPQQPQIKNGRSG